ncbi:hypothetical protein V6N13_109335 [Hibiscus sabdariffa]
MQQEHKQILECVNFGVFTRDDNHDYYDGFNDKDDGEINDEEEETVLVPVTMYRANKHDDRTFYYMEGAVTL